MDAVTIYLRQLVGKVLGLAQSRKFWVLVAASVTVAQALGTGEINAFQAAQMQIAALAVYMGATALEDGLARR